MNSEELEQSLRTEFESYLKDVIAEMKQGVIEFQEKVNADFARQKEQIDESFKELTEKFGKDRALENSFTESVAEHLKLARDEGASITATAIAEAEKLAEEEESGPDFSGLRDAINDISVKDSQSEILKALVNHANDLTPRGAFFIVKNEHLVGWRVFGREDHQDPQVVREVFFPVASNTALSSAVESLRTVSGVESGSEDDVMYRNKLGFLHPERMYAIPLIARGRGVAVLYADSGESGDAVGLEALESLMRVAGLTVEVLAAAPAPVHHEEPSAESVEETAVEETPDYSNVEDSVYVQESAPETYEPADEVVSYDAAEESSDFEPVETPFEYEPVASPSSVYEVEADADNEIPGYGTFDEAEDESEATFEAEADSFDESPVEFDSDSDDYDIDPDEAASVSDQTENWDTPVSPPASAFTDSFDVSDSDHEVSEFDVEETVDEEAPVYEFESASDSDDFETVSDEPEDESFEETQEFQMEAPETEIEDEVESPEAQSEPVVRPRFADRNLDLPIEVGEDERRLHNDARRFARLLVSEIKLYNEQKVKEGRESSDLYERLREAIDRSREMYDKRVQPPVAAKFDYFNYELVNTLAEGDEAKLGGSYPGPSV